MPFFRQFQHLLPRSRAWTLTVQKTLRDFFVGLSKEPAAFRTYVDDIWTSIFPPTATELEEFEQQFGLHPPAPTDADRRDAIDGAWKSPGGQSNRYIQDVLHASGFTQLFVHDWWSSGPSPYVPRNPRLYTTDPQAGTSVCRGPVPSQVVCRPNKTTEGFTFQYVCNNFQGNDTGYLVNKDLTPRAQPPIPDDSDYWPFFIYICGPTFPDAAIVDPARRDELEALLLRICPTQLWIVLIQIPGGDIFDDSFDLSFN